MRPSVPYWAPDWADRAHDAAVERGDTCALPDCWQDATHDALCDEHRRERARIMADLAPAFGD
jgi:hypothetical protein